MSDSNLRAFRFQDDRSDKFWRIESAGTDFAVQWGRTGTIGKYQVKEFDSTAECEGKVAGLVASKVKSGYQPFPNFDPEQQLYISDDEVGLHPLTSHPRFRKHFSADFYYDCVDEEAPFGSDEGSDALAEIEKRIRKNQALDFESFPKELVETTWGMVYLPAIRISRAEVETIVGDNDGETNMILSDMVTYATAFAQIKITGNLDQALRERAFSSLRRMAITADVLGWSTTGQPSEIQEIMIQDLSSYSPPVQVH